MKKMDYTIGSQAGRAGRKWTATALTDRAKERTPEPVTFASRSEALTFLKDSQAEGYRFSGAELVLNLSASPFRIGVVASRRELVATRLRRMGVDILRADFESLGPALLARYAEIKQRNRL